MKKFIPFFDPNWEPFPEKSQQSPKEILISRPYFHIPKIKTYKVISFKEPYKPVQKSLKSINCPRIVSWRR